MADTPGEEPSGGIAQSVERTRKRSLSSHDEAHSPNANPAKNPRTLEEQAQETISAPREPSPFIGPRRSIPLPVRPAAAPIGSPRAYHAGYRAASRRFGAAPSAYRAYNRAAYQYGHQNHYWNHHHGAYQHGHIQHGVYDHGYAEYAQYGWTYPPALGQQGAAYNQSSFQHRQHHGHPQPQQGWSHSYGQSQNQSQAQSQGPSQNPQPPHIHEQGQQRSLTQQGVVIGGGVTSYIGAPTYNPGYGPHARDGYNQ